MTEEKEISQGYSHTKAGAWLFEACAKATKFLCRHRWLYYLLACTWGILTTICGLIAAGVMKIAELCGAPAEVSVDGWMIQVKAGPRLWGGCSIGLVYFRDFGSSEELDAHEFGHSFQNCLLGPLCIFMALIPSAIRYWVRELKYGRKGETPPTAYDAVWFEDAATQCGKYAKEAIK